MLWRCFINIHELIFVWKEKNPNWINTFFLCEKLRVLFTNLLYCIFLRDHMTCYICESLIHSRNSNAYLKCVSFVLEVNFAEIRVSVKLFGCHCFLCHTFTKTNCFLFKWIRAYNFVQMRILEKHWLLIIESFHKTNFHIILFEIDKMYKYIPSYYVCVGCSLFRYLPAKCWRDLFRIEFTWIQGDDTNGIKCMFICILSNYI